MPLVRSVVAAAAAAAADDDADDDDEVVDVTLAGDIDGDGVAMMGSAIALASSQDIDRWARCSTSIPSGQPAASVVRHRSSISLSLSRYLCVSLEVSTKEAGVLWRPQLLGMAQVATGERGSDNDKTRAARVCGVCMSSARALSR